MVSRIDDRIFGQCKHIRDIVTKVVVTPRVDSGNGNLII